jgi:c-di-GMP-binding flagellar brake protein YcgR
MKKQIIPIHLGTKLLLQLRTRANRVSSKLIGLEHGEYLIVSIPALSMSKIKSLFTHGKPVVVRYLHEGTALGFEANVLGMIINPVRLVFLNYPEKIQDMNLRKHRRSECYLPAEIVLGEKSSSGFINDISWGGCSFSCKNKASLDIDSLGVGNYIVIKFAVPGVEGKLEVNSIIRNFSVDSSNMFFGLQFEELPEDIKYKLNNYLGEMQLLKGDE